MINQISGVLTFGYNECVSDVGRIVHAEADGQDNVDAGQGVDRDSPQVQESNNVHLCIRWIINIVSLTSRESQSRLTKVRKTQSKTIIQIWKLAKRIKVMTKTHTMARPKFLHNSNPITSSVSQAA